MQSTKSWPGTTEEADEEEDAAAVDAPMATAGVWGMVIPDVIDDDEVGAGVDMTTSPPLPSRSVLISLTTLLMSFAFFTFCSSFRRPPSS